VRDLDSQQTNLVADQHIKDVNSIAAKRVLDMGYTQPQVEVAIKQTRQRIGTFYLLCSQMFNFFLEGLCLRKKEIK
jgi:hypothetical protein